MKKINIILFSMFLFSISSQYTVAKSDSTPEVDEKATWFNSTKDSCSGLLGNDLRNKRISFQNDLNQKKFNILDNSQNENINTADKLKKIIELNDIEAEKLSIYINDEHAYNEKTFFERWKTASAYTWIQIGILSTLSAVAVYKLYSAVFANKAAEDDDEL